MDNRFVSGSSNKNSRSATPSSNGKSRFTTQATSAEDVLKEQTVGLVHLSDFRKRRAEALERKELERSGSPAGITSSDSAAVGQPAKKKKKKAAAKGKLSFALDDEQDGDSGASITPTPRTATLKNDTSEISSENDNPTTKKRLGPNIGVVIAPKALTKSARLREIQAQEELHKHFVVTREAVKATEIVIPFVFYDGTNVPGGFVRMKKGDPIWLFLDKARKLGAELGVGVDKSSRDWARVSVDDLMFVRADVVIPHHYEFYYFLANNVNGFNGPLFPYSSQPTAATPSLDEQDPLKDADYDPLDRSTKGQSKTPSTSVPDSELEGAQDDATITKVVDRRWYERNRHIFPASVWEEYAPDKDFSHTRRKDTEGNSYFFS
ncbi:XAP5-domain-containing protein [Delitschia confertaspora ATCC 74209]|uniref:XAP5-domain-containing protein n=1 Tax=Delitschia confertaspora ATCC 74209 TaxID=1513339 RepID=A0A9P4MXG2_9PLEO|nr:XAP5-domain-containing protein [Delitschia confertaspora ATCC 74209]